MRGRNIDFKGVLIEVRIMAATTQQVFDEALRLPSESRALLAEKLVESLVSAIDPAIEQAHLQLVEERRGDYQAGKMPLVDGDEALKQVRAAIRR